MRRSSYRSITFTNSAYTKEKRALPPIVLAVLLIALAVLVSGVAAQKDGDPPVRDPYHDRSDNMPVDYRLPEKKVEHHEGNQFNRPHTLRLAEDCSLAPLYGFLDQKMAEGKLDETPVQVGNEMRIVTDRQQLRHLSAVRCVEEIIPGWQVTPDQSVQPSASESEMAENVGNSPDQAVAADDTGSISGIVTAELDGSPLYGIIIWAYQYNGSAFIYIGLTATDVNGEYIYDGLEPGTYRIEFYDGTKFYAKEVYDDVPILDDGTDIPIASGAAVTGIDAALVEAGHITGTVTAESGGALLENIEVCAYFDNGSYWEILHCRYTDANGDYDIEGLLNESFRIEYSDSSGFYKTEYYDDAPDIDSADDVLAAVGSTISGIDAALADGGHITGTVTAEAGGAPLLDIAACAYTNDGTSWVYVRCAYTDAGGNYDIGGLETGVYRVEFYDTNRIFLGEYYDNVPDLSSAIDINVAIDNTTSGIDAALTEGGHISGTVTAEAGAASLLDIEACAYSYDGSSWVSAGCDYTDAAGDYDIGGLVTGTYRVKYNDLNYIYVSEYYDNAPDIDSADDIPVTTSSTTPGKNAALTEYGYIAGTVTAEIGDVPLASIYVCAYYYNGFNWQYGGCEYTDINGDYNIGALLAGVYRLRFYDYNGDYVTEFYDDVQTLDAAGDVPVSAGGTTSGINAALAAAGHITGNVTAESDGAALYDIEVCAIFDNGSYWQSARCVLTDIYGDYNIGGLESGIYRVRFTDYWYDTYLTEYFDNASDIDSATDISVTVGSTTSSIDAVLTDLGHITGTVTAEVDGSPLSNIYTCALFFNGAYWEYAGNCDYGDANGNYDISGLFTGDYRVEFFDFANSFGTEYFDNFLNIDNAADVSVTMGSTTAGIDAALAEATDPPPDNDDIDYARAISPIPYLDTVDTRAASTAVDDPLLPCGPSNKGHGSVWYAITPQWGSLLTADTFGSNYDTVLTVWEGSRGSLSAVACNDDWLDLQSQVSNVPLVGGTTYYIEVAAYGSTMGKLALHIDLLPDTPFVDCISNTGNDASIAVPAGVTINGIVLEPGDEIALYTPDGSICAGHDIWTGASLGLTAWGDDNQTAERDGFTAGEEMVYRLWDQSTGILYSDIDVTYAVGNGLYSGDSIYAVSALNVTTSVTQDISLNAGWNMVSSYIDPDNPLLEDLLASIESGMVLMKNCDGSVYWPAMFIDEIVNWDVLDCYQIYMTHPAVLSITGQQIDPAQTPIELLTGWNCIPYLRDNPMPIIPALSSIHNEIVLVKNGRGEVYWPAYGVDQIGDLQPGECYQVYLDAPATLVYPVN